MKSRFSIRSISEKIVLEKGRFQIHYLESVSESCTFFTQVKSLFHHQRYYRNNSTDTKSFFVITSFYCLGGSMFYPVYEGYDVNQSKFIIRKL